MSSGWQTHGRREKRRIGRTTASARVRSWVREWRGGSVVDVDCSSKGSGSRHACERGTSTTHTKAAVEERLPHASTGGRLEGQGLHG